MKRTVLVSILAIACGAGPARAQAPVADYFSSTSLLDGQALPAGTTIEAYDSNGIRCGVAFAISSGGFLVHVYGNDPMTPGVDEGANDGELLQWRVAGVVARPVDTQWIANLVGAFQDLRWENGAAKEIRLDVRTIAVQPETWSDVKSRYRP